MDSCTPLIWHGGLPHLTSNSLFRIEPRIVLFWSLQNHGSSSSGESSGSAPAPLLAVSLFIPRTTTGRTVLVSGRSRITYHPVLDSPATRIIRFCARRWGPMHGVAIRKGHLFFTLCDGGLSISNVDHYFNSKIIAYISDQ